MSYHKKYQSEVDTFVKVCHKLAAHHYVTGYGGNLAWKLEDNLILITPTMMNKGDVTTEDVVFISLAGDTVEGIRRPTGEKQMYLKFFNERPDIVSVIHCHAPHVGAFAIAQDCDLLMRPLYPETTTEVGPVPLVPYAQPLTEALAQKFGPFLQKYNAFLMANHGVVSMSPEGIQWTSFLIELLEESAHSILKAKAAGLTLNELSEQDVIDLGNVMRERGLPLFGAPGTYQSLEELYF